MKQVMRKSSLRGLINQAAFLPCSKANGPGERAVVWVQGCLQRCAGCFNPEMQAMKRRRLVSPGKLAAGILAQKNIEGVTFSGGEPFLQAEALAILAETVAKHGLNIVIFTGYSWEELKNSQSPAKQRLLAAADLLIAGRYVEELPGSGYLQSSANQELVFLTDKLKSHPDLVNKTNLLEFIIDEQGNITATGIMNWERERLTVKQL
jgi:anaerobic ribonucleoside-triphosphate reductase activating protein